MPKIIALAGNPNVGKSTVFNALTGMRQHTGNWPGKTVSNASGTYTYQKETYEIYDLPGTYSLISHSEEEKVARDFICFGDIDTSIIVCDAVCLERNLNLALQVLEINPKAVLCVNLLDEAEKKKIHVDLKKLEERLGIPVIGASAREKRGLTELIDAVSHMVPTEKKFSPIFRYSEELETAIMLVLPYVEEHIKEINSRWVCLKLIDDDPVLMESLKEKFPSVLEDERITSAIQKARTYLLEKDILVSEIKDIVVHTLVDTAEEIAAETVTYEKLDYQQRDRKIDKILTNKWTGIPLMLALLLTIFWLTMTGANVPSNYLSKGLFWISDHLEAFLGFIQVPSVLIDIFIHGIYKVLAWVISVMLPPMAIFFPLFTLLEDLGYLPRIAFNLDKAFHKCSACGKQALTMCMGFGCNAAGVTGCRIIDSPRERLIAILTNVFVPCNGRFPTLIMLISIFFVGISGSSFTKSLILTGVILAGILMTLLISKILSKTVLKGMPSSFTLELPPYRKPQIGKVVVRSIFDRTLFVLGRAVMVAAPAGLIIWIMANVEIGGLSLLKQCAVFLDPFARVFGMDGVILMAFILGFPANEIVIPIMIMGYMSLGSITDISDFTVLQNLFVDNGWTILTALCVMTFCLFHFPCSTTVLTIKKETGSLKWTIFSMILPTLVGLLCCFIFAQCYHIFGF